MDSLRVSWVPCVGSARVGSSGMGAAGIHLCPRCLPQRSPAASEDGSVDSGFLPRAPASFCQTEGTCLSLGGGGWAGWEAVNSIRRGSNQGEVGGGEKEPSFLTLCGGRLWDVLCILPQKVLRATEPQMFTATVQPLSIFLELSSLSYFSLHWVSWGPSIYPGYFKRSS